MIKNKKRFFWFTFSIYFLLIPFILISIYLFKDTLTQVLLLYPQQPTLLSLIGSNYLHTDLPHLSMNLLAYLIIISPIYYFDYQTNKKMLLINPFILFICLPFITSLFNSISFAEYGTNLPLKGFSAIATGTIGYLAYSLLHYLQQHYQLRFKRGIFQMMWLILYVNLALISIIYQIYLIALIIIVLISITLTITHQDYNKILTLINQISPTQRILILVSLLFSFSAAILGLFPENLQQGTTLVNIYAHYIGYIFGFSIPALLSEYLLKKKMIHQ